MLVPYYVEVANSLAQLCYCAVVLLYSSNMYVENNGYTSKQAILVMKTIGTALFSIKNIRI